MFERAKTFLQGLRGAVGKPLADASTDPQRYFNALLAMPNPDTILRKMGRAEEVYFSILQDPHVIGDVRSIRGSFRSEQYRLVAGDDGDSKSLAALELCEQWMATTRPNGVTTEWLEVMWQMASAIFSGYTAHELVWKMEGGKFLPGEVVDRPGRRIVFNGAGDPLLITRANMMGEAFDPYRFVINRHMATTTNPYGVALMSSCFWAWTYKTGGWRFFVKFCERHGLPWPFGRYPMGTNDKDVDQFEAALSNMLEAGYILAPEGSELELLSPTISSSSNLPQQALIELANREMSKALTGQAMVAELNGVGSRAASETAKGRQGEINKADRDISVSGFGEIFRWITLFNFGDGVAAPRLEFFKPEKAGKDRAETYQVAANMGAKPSRVAMLEELGIPAAEDDGDALLPAARPALQLPQKAAPGGTPQADFSAIPGLTFAKAVGMTDDEAVQLATDAADRAIEDRMIAPIADMLARYEAEGKTLADFHAALEELVGVLDDEALREVIDRAMSYAILRGAATQAA